MLKIKHSQLNWLLAGMTLAVMGVSIAPVSAQRAIVIDGGYGVRHSCGAACRQTSPSVGSFIYGSPIPTPMPVDPTTGLMPQRNHYPDYSYGVRRSRSVGSFIYGSPIPTPMPVDPTTGLMPQRNHYPDYSYGVRRSRSVGSFIYGSPIPMPMPVDPTTGLMIQRNHYRDYSHPQFRQNIRNSTLINPIIRDSTLVNPVIINNSWRRTPFSGGRCLTTSCFAPTRVIITYPR